MRKVIWFTLLLLSILVSTGCTRSASNESIQLPPTKTQIQVQSTNTSLPTLIRLTDTPAPTATEELIQPEVMIADFFAIAFLSDVDLLNLRAGPGLAADVILTLDPYTRDLQATGEREAADGQTWREFRLNDGSTGWLSSQFITEQVESAAFCSDQRVSNLIESLDQAITNQDGKMLARLISPIHGLTIWHNWWNPEVTYASPDVVEELFISTVDYDWGTEDGSGSPITGPFKDKILPKLQDVFLSDHSSHCNILDTGISAGGTAGMLTWPSEYTNLNYIALFRSAPSADDELNWRTWVVGVEYVDGIPYVVSLVQYYWEI